MSHSAMSMAPSAPETALPRKCALRFRYCQWCSMRNGSLPRRYGVQASSGLRGPLALQISKPIGHAGLQRVARLIAELGFSSRQHTGAAQVRRARNAGLQRNMCAWDELPGEFGNFTPFARDSAGDVEDAVLEGS